MTSVKVKLRKSSVKGKPGKVYYQVIHKRKVKQIDTNYVVYPSEWDTLSERIQIDERTCAERRKILHSYNEKILWDQCRLRNIILSFNLKEDEYTVDEIVNRYLKISAKNSLHTYIKKQIVLLQDAGRKRTAETYAAALSSFMKFRINEDLPFEGITSDLLKQYQGWLLERGIKKNSSSFYMRILRTVYNKASEEGLTTNKNPFRHVYTGIDKTKKRAINAELIRKMKIYDLSLYPSREFARDMFLFSFYTRGMSYIDMAYLKKSDLQHGYLTYCRRKTGQQLTIKWEKCMKEITDKYSNPDSKYLLPIIKSPLLHTEKYEDEYSLYLNSRHLINYHLQMLSKELEIFPPLTMYVARHSWASIAKQKNIPLSVISDGLGHESEKTTRIYLATLSNSIIDEANKKIIEDV